MQKSSFLEILRALDKDELKRFEAFLSSPYFNTRNNVIKLFGIIKKYAPEFDNKKLDKEELWKKSFPGKEYNYGMMKNIIYDITKLAERFLEIENFNAYDRQRMNSLLEKLSEKHLESIFLSKYNTLEKNFFKSSAFYNEFYGEYLVLKRKKYFLEAYNPRLRTKFFANEIAEFMIFDFMANFSNNFNNIYIEETEFNEVSENDFVRLYSKAIFTNPELEKYFGSLNSGSGKDYKIAGIFFKLMKCYLNPQSIDFFFDFKKTLLENDKYISAAGMRNLYACLGSALDNCNDVSKINKLRELFEIISILVEKKIFISEEGKVIPTLYMLAVKTSAYLKNPDFIEKIRKEFLKKVEPGLQSNLDLYTRAYLHYSRNEFDDALNYVNKISIDTFQMKYHLRNLHVLISFEKNDYNMFLYIKDSHKHFLSKNKSVSESYKESNMKFLNYTNTLFKLKETGGESDIALTLKTVIKDVVVNKHWLIEKLKELTPERKS